MNKAKQPDISIILPVYNVEKQLVKCLSSISNQEFSGTFEIIAVEAFSTDNSLNLLKSFQLNEPRLIIIEKDYREPLATSRITGIKASSGDYIMHVDSDDWLLPNALERLFQICNETDADIVVFDYIKEDIKGVKSILKNIKEKIVTTDKLKVQNHFYGACWNKIVKREMNTNMIYGKIGVTNTEDLLYSTEILLKAKSICLLPEPYYLYFTNLESGSFTLKPDQLIQRLIIILEQIKLIGLEYNANSQLINNILKYIEKNVFLAISQATFLTKEGGQNFDLINTFRLFPEMTEKRIKKLSMSMTNRYYSLVQVLLLFGIKPVLGILKRAY